MSVRVWLDGDEVKRVAFNALHNTAWKCRISDRPNIGTRRDRGELGRFAGERRRSVVRRLGRQAMLRKPQDDGDTVAHQGIFVAVHADYEW